MIGKITKENLWNRLLFACSTLAFPVLIYLSLEASVWVDEAYTMGIVQYSIRDLIQVTAQDVHPPLYYIFVKIVLVLFGIKDSYLSIMVARVVSLIPFAVMWLIGVRVIRKWFGEAVGGLFCVCLLFAPKMLETALEIRMYSWAILFLLVTYLAVYRLALSEKTEAVTFVILGISVLCAFYTHYFAAIGAAVILAICFLFLLAYNRRQILPFLVMSVIDAVFYLPWLMVIAAQIARVGQGYWIAPINRDSLIRYMWYAFRMEENQAGSITGSILILAALACLLLVIRDPKKENLLMLGAMSVMPLTTASGVLLSVLFRPIFVERYMLPTLACFWLGFAYFIAQWGRKKHLWIVISILLLGIGVYQYEKNIHIAAENRGNMEKVQDLFEQMGKDDLVIHTSLNTQIPSAYYGGESTHYTVEESSTLRIDQIVFDNVREVMTVQELKKYVEEGKRVWCFEYPESYFVDEAWMEILNEGHRIGKYALDWCEFQVYMWD